MPNRISGGSKRVVLGGGYRLTRIHALVRQTLDRKDTLIYENGKLVYAHIKHQKS